MVRLVCDMQINGKVNRILSFIGLENEYKTTDVLKLSLPLNCCLIIHTYPFITSEVALSCEHLNHILSLGPSLKNQLRQTGLDKHSFTCIDQEVKMRINI